MKDRTLGPIYAKIVAELRQLDAGQIMELLDEVDSGSDDAVARSNLRTALFSALCYINRELAAEYLISAPEDGLLQFSASSFFESWMHEDPSALFDWLDAGRQDLLRNSMLFKQAETAAVSYLIKKEPATAMERVKHLPPGHMRDVVIRVFSDSYLLAPDLAIYFLRESLSRTGHEDLVGEACGLQLYREDEAAIQAFFRKHDTTREEGEAILFKSVKMDMNMGLGKDPISEFNKRMRDIAEAEGFGNANDLTAVILGIRSDRDHQDKQAVDELLSYNPSSSALQIFLGERGKDMDAAERKRVTEQIRLLDSL